MFPNHATTVNKNIKKHNKQVDKNIPSAELIDFLYDNDLPEGVDVSLSSLNECDSVWDAHRLDAYHMGNIYALNSEFERYSDRIVDCSGFLKFGYNENGLILKQAYFCKLRYCAVCQWRKSLFWKAMMYQTYDRIIQTHPTHRFVFLTLTVKNPKITDIADTLKHMNNAWSKLKKRASFESVVTGWVRTTEITRPKDETANTHAHPHFHAILMVDPSYFGRNYIKQANWVAMWRSCLKVDYDPVIDIRTVKPKKGAIDNGMRGAIAETLKYAVKPAEVIKNADTEQGREWFYELTRQTHKKRFVASGGLLKDALKKNKDEKDAEKVANEDMIATGNDDEITETDDRRLNFTFYPTKAGYFYNPNYNE
jgi:plasmid rolling circle replication initiator protein Rep